MTALSISIVTFRSEAALLRRTLSTLNLAVQEARESLPDLSTSLYLIENDIDESASLQQVQASEQADELPAFDKIVLHQSDRNLGFAGGHNSVMALLDSEIHLVLNPDVELRPDALLLALQYLESHEDVGISCPNATDASGAALHLCKQYPSVFDLFIRGFLPARLRAWFKPRLARYEMHELLQASAAEQDNIKIVSGCCMFVRTSLLRRLNGFDERFFLYFEDFDFSLRASEVSRLAYLPSVQIVHHGGEAAKKGIQHISLFVRSAYKFFSMHGWRWI